MLSDSDLNMIIAAGEDEKIERKKIVNLTNKAEKAELILDFLSLVNAHSSRPAYLLVGVDNKGDLFDVGSQGHDDARFQQIVTSYIEPPVQFSYYERLIRGVTIGVIEIAPSQSRFHVVLKDLSDGHRKFLEKGDTRIKRGSSKQRPMAWDYSLLRQEIAQSNAPQPQIMVQFEGGAKEVELRVERQPKSVPGMDLMGLASYSELSYLPGTGRLTFEVHNEGNHQADNVYVFITIPEECSLQHEIDPPGYYLISERITAGLQHSTTVSPSQGEITLSFPRIVHGLRRTSEVCYVAFPRIGESFDLLWSAHAGNMMKTMNGRLTVKVI